MTESERFFEGLNELPIWNWHQAIKTGELAWLLKGYPSGEVHQYIKDGGAELQVELVGQWQKLNNEFVDTFGISDRHKSALLKRRKILKMKLEALTSGDKSKNTLVRREEAMLEALIAPSEKANFERTLASVQKWGGFNINHHETSVIMFHTYLQMMDEEAQRLKEQAAKMKARNG